MVLCGWELGDDIHIPPWANANADTALVLDCADVLFLNNANSKGYLTGLTKPQFFLEKPPWVLGFSGLFWVIYIIWIIKIYFFYCLI